MPDACLFSDACLGLMSGGASTALLLRVLSQGSVSSCLCLDMLREISHSAGALPTSDPPAALS